MRCALPESARVERFDDQNGSRERGTFVRRAETGRERFRVRGVGWGDGLTAGSWRGAPPTCRPAASEMPAGCGSGSPEVPGPPRVVPPSKPPALLVAEVEWGSRVSQSRGAVAAGWRWSRGGGGGEGRKEGKGGGGFGGGGEGKKTTAVRCDRTGGEMEGRRRFQSRQLQLQLPSGVGPFQRRGGGGRGVGRRSRRLVGWTDHHDEDEDEEATDPHGGCAVGPGAVSPVRHASSRNFSYSPSHRIFRRMYEVLNIDENKN